MNYKKMKYKEYLTCKPLDIIGFHSTKNCISKIISCCEQCVDNKGYFTHCGIVIDANIIKTLKTKISFNNCVLCCSHEIEKNKIITLDDNKLYILEATSSGTINTCCCTYNTGYPGSLESPTGEIGVQIRPLYDVIRYHIENGSTVFVRQMTTIQRNSILADIELKNRIQEYIKSEIDAMYQCNPLILMVSVFNCLDFICPNCCKQAIFCSKLVAEVIKLFSNDISEIDNPKYITPDDLFFKCKKIPYFDMFRIELQ